MGYYPTELVAIPRKLKAGISFVGYSSFISFLQIYIGPRRGKRNVLENRDIVKELKVGMLVAVQGKSEIPTIGEVTHIPPNPSKENEVSLIVSEQESSIHKSKWLRVFKRTTKICIVNISDIILYDFQLTNKGAIRKSTREFLQNVHII